MIGALPTTTAATVHRWDSASRTTGVYPTVGRPGFGPAATPHTTGNGIGGMADRAVAAAAISETSPRSGGGSRPTATAYLAGNGIGLMARRVTDADPSAPARSVLCSRQSALWAGCLALLDFSPVAAITMDTAAKHQAGSAIGRGSNGAAAPSYLAGNDTGVMACSVTDAGTWSWLRTAVCSRQSALWAGCLAVVNFGAVAGGALAAAAKREADTRSGGSSSRQPIVRSELGLGSSQSVASGPRPHRSGEESFLGDTGAECRRSAADLSGRQPDNPALGCASTVSEPEGQYFFGYSWPIGRQSAEPSRRAARRFSLMATAGAHTDPVCALHSTDSHCRSRQPAIRRNSALERAWSVAGQNSYKDRAGPGHTGVCSSGSKQSAVRDATRLAVWHARPVADYPSCSGPVSKVSSGIRCGGSQQSAVWNHPALERAQSMAGQNSYKDRASVSNPGVCCGGSKQSAVRDAAEVVSRSARLLADYSAAYRSGEKPFASDTRTVDRSAAGTDPQSDLGQTTTLGRGGQWIYCPADTSGNSQQSAVRDATRLAVWDARPVADHCPDTNTLQQAGSGIRSGSCRENAVQSGLVLGGLEPVAGNGPNHTGKKTISGHTWAIGRFTAAPNTQLHHPGQTVGAGGHRSAAADLLSPTIRCRHCGQPAVRDASRLALGGAQSMGAENADANRAGPYRPRGAANNYRTAVRLQKDHYFTRGPNRRDPRIERKHLL